MGPGATTAPREGIQRIIAMLKSPDYGKVASRTGGHLPYRVDLLREDGFELRWTDAHMTGRLSRGRLRDWVWKTEATAVPWVQALATWRMRRHADVTVAMFESEGHGVTLTRHFRPRRNQHTLVIIACWLADIAVSGSDRRRRLYRWLYQTVDRVIVFSPNQAETLERLLAIDPARIEVVHFGVDLDELAAIPVGDEGVVFAAGRDMGRDWATLADAGPRFGWDVELVTRWSQLEGIDLPPEVTDVGVLDHNAYLRRLGAASVVVIPTEVREYPTGQTVLLEAMALGKACVVTDTPAMRSYVDDGRTAVLVPPHDVDAFRAAVDSLLADRSRREAIGAAAHADVLQQGGAAEMWRHIARTIDEAIDQRAGSRSR